MEGDGGVACDGYTAKWLQEVVALAEDVAADEFEDKVGAEALLEDVLVEVGLGVVDGEVCTEALDKGDFVGATSEADDGAAVGFEEFDGGGADTACGCLHEDGLAGLDTGLLKEGNPGGHEVDEDGGVFLGGKVGEGGQGHEVGDMDVLGVGSVLHA